MDESWHSIWLISYKALKASNVRLDSVKGRAYLPLQRVMAIIALEGKILANRFQYARNMQRLLGYIASTLAATLHFRLHTRPLQNWFIQAFNCEIHPQWKKASIPRVMFYSLNWWTELPHLLEQVRLRA